MSLAALIEPLSGAVNGTNQDFYTSAQYQTGSVQVFLNGQLKRVDLADGWIEMGLNHVRLNEAPKIGDVVQAYYCPA